jgi:hypothetical protein
MSQNNQVKLSFVSCVSSLLILEQRLMTSPCLQAGGMPLTASFNATSAAQGFNSAMTAAMACSSIGDSWLVWAHQDVFLPVGWDAKFIQALSSAQKCFPHLAVAGVYGVAGTGENAVRAGHVLDRGIVLRGMAPLPCLVDSLDELLFAVRVSSGLLLDDSLGFDFYATDLVLQAQAKGLQCAALDSFCEHWSDTPTGGIFPAEWIRRVQTNGATFERKWSHRLPVMTPCFEISKPGDVALAIANNAATQILK